MDEGDVLFLAAIGFLMLDIALVIFYFIWTKWILKTKLSDHKRYVKLAELRNEDLEGYDSDSIQSNSNLTALEVDSHEMQFLIPGYDVEQNETGLVHMTLKKRLSAADVEEVLNINEDLYLTPRQRKLSMIPKVGFELYYYIEPQELEIRLINAIHLPEFANEDIIVSILLTKSPLIHHSSRVNGPDAKFEELFRFPLARDEVNAEDNSLKFNVWTVDRYSRKTPFGFSTVNVKDVLQAHGCMPLKGHGVVTKEIVRTDMLTSESVLGEVLFSLSYLPSANRISVIMIKAKDLCVYDTDKEIVVTITLVKDQHKIKTKHVHVKKASSNPVFNEQIVFNLHQNKKKSHNVLTVCLKMKFYVKTSPAKKDLRILGKCIVGVSEEVMKAGREHWDEMLASTSGSVAKWHALVQN